MLPDSEWPVGVITEIRARSEFGSRSYPRSHPQVFLIFWPFSFCVWSFIVTHLIIHRNIFIGHCDFGTIFDLIQIHLYEIRNGVYDGKSDGNEVELGDQGVGGRSRKRGELWHKLSLRVKRIFHSTCDLLPMFSLKMLICLTSFRLFCQRHYSLGLALVIPSSDPSVRVTLLEQFSLFSPLSFILTENYHFWSPFSAVTERVATG